MGVLRVGFWIFVFCLIAAVVQVVVFQRHAAQSRPVKDNSSKKPLPKIQQSSRPAHEQQAEGSSSGANLRVHTKTAADRFTESGDWKRNGLPKETNLVSQPKHDEREHHAPGAPVVDEPWNESLVLGDQLPGAKWKFLTPEMVETVYTSHETAKAFALKGSVNFEAGACAVDEWQYVTGVAHGMLIGLAYERKIGSSFEVWVLVVMHVSLQSRCNFSCQFSDPATGRNVNVPARCTSFKASSKPGHCSFFLTCPRDREQPAWPSVQLAFLESVLGRSTPILRAPEAPPSGLAVCVAPAYKVFRAHQLDTFLSWYSHAGAATVFLYNHSWIRAVDSVIHRHRGYVATIPWKFGGGKTLPLGTDGGCWAHLSSYGNFQHLQMAHCMATATVQNFAFAASIDIDELVWNRKQDLPAGWLRAMLEREEEKGLCSLQVRNTFVTHCEAFWRTKQIWRSRDIWPHGVRSKEIWVPHRVLKPEVHTVERCIRETKPKVAPPDKLVLMHLRYLTMKEAPLDVVEPGFAALMQRFCGNETSVHRPRPRPAWMDPDHSATSLVASDSAHASDAARGGVQEGGQPDAGSAQHRPVVASENLDLELEMAVEGASTEDAVTAVLRWEAGGQRYVMAYSAEAPTARVVRIRDEFGRTGNRFVECQSLVYFGIMCGVVVRCDLDLNGNHQGAVTFLDARRVRDGFPDLGLSTRRPFAKASLGCEVESVPASALFFKRPRGDEQREWQRLLPVLRGAAAAAFGALGPGSVFGKACDAGGERERTLVGHVRSGDVFSAEARGGSSRVYGQPPLSYWLRAVRDRGFERVRLYVEDLNNPAAKQLLELARGALAGRLEVKVRERFDTLMFDLMCARHVVMGASTMNSVVGSSWNVASMVVPFSCLGELRNKFGNITVESSQHARNLPMHKTAFVPMPGYSPRQSRCWLNTDEQRQEMLDYQVASAPIPCEQEARLANASSVASLPKCPVVL